MTAFDGAVDATFAAFGIDAIYTPAGGEPFPVRVIARRPDTIVGFGETRIHAETATFELRVSEVANPRPSDQLTVGAETFVIQGEPERRDPDRSSGRLMCDQVEQSGFDDFERRPTSGRRCKDHRVGVRRAPP